MDILNLSSKPEFADVCGAWSYGQWGCHLPLSWGVTLDSSVDGYKKRTQNAELPQTWVAVEDSKCIGMVSLKEKELEQYSQFGPWVGSLFVHPDHRKSGLGAHLMNVVEQKAMDAGYDELYLFSSDAERYYLDHHNGWEVLKRFSDPIKPQKQIPLMKKNLS